jgi:glycosyltransferase involved in cell wall biosynthesis
VQAIPSKWEEPFGMVAIEAMMRGTAVVASDSGGLRDIVRDGVTGLLIVPGDVEVWSKALTRMLTDRHLCEVMGTAGREVALEEYTAERAVDRVVSLHAELAGKAK